MFGFVLVGFVYGGFVSGSMGGVLQNVMDVSEWAIDAAYDNLEQQLPTMVCI